MKVSITTAGLLAALCLCMISCSSQDAFEPVEEPVSVEESAPEPKISSEADNQDQAPAQELAEGTPEAAQAAADAAFADVFLLDLAMGGEEMPETGTIEDVTFLEFWDIDGYGVELYRCENVGGDVLASLLLAVTQDETGQWHGIAQDGIGVYLLDEPGHAYTDAEIADYKQTVQKALNGEYNATEPSASYADEPTDAVSESFVTDGAIYTNQVEGNTFMINALSDASTGDVAYELYFDDGNIFTVAFDGTAYDNSGEECLSYSDDGFGVGFLYNPNCPDRLIVTGSSRGSAVYAGYYFTS